VSASAAYLSTPRRDDATPHTPTTTRRDDAKKRRARARDDARRATTRDDRFDGGATIGANNRAIDRSIDRFD